MSKKFFLCFLTLSAKLPVGNWLNLQNFPLITKWFCPPKYLNMSQKDVSPLFFNFFVKNICVGIWLNCKSSPGNTNEFFAKPKTPNMSKTRFGVFEPFVKKTHPVPKILGLIDKKLRLSKEFFWSLFHSKMSKMMFFLVLNFFRSKKSPWLAFKFTKVARKTQIVLPRRPTPKFQKLFFGVF